jgi:DNA invertase Pin-like site-specific DNA recombinase
LAAGCQVVRTEKLSGKSREGREQLATLLEFIGPGDVLVCVELDRLGRSTRDVLISCTSSTRRVPSYAFSNPIFRPMDRLGNMVLTVLGMVAEMELGFIKAFLPVNHTILIKN